MNSLRQESRWSSPALRREHAAVWATRLWEWCADHDSDGVLCLNDDVVLAPKFLEICDAILDSVPEEVISLHTNFPAARDESTKGANWVRCYGLTGPAYILPPGAARSLLNWEAPWSFISAINEDNRANHWAWERQRPMWCAIPAPVIHDTEVPSSLGYDHHAHRTPTVPWTDYDDTSELTDPGYWKPTGDVPHIPNHWMPVEKLEYVRRVLKEGGQFCPMCVTRQGVVGPKAGPLLCVECVANVANACILGRRA